MLRYKKFNLIHNLINANTTDSKKLYSVISEVTGPNKQNPLLESTSDQQLAKDFAAFFLNKIQNIKNSSKAYQYIHQNSITYHKMERFSTLTDQEIYQTI